jgi:hypothetical protein
MQATITYKNRLWYVNDIPYDYYADAAMAVGVEVYDKVWITRINTTDDTDTYLLTW